MNFYFQSILFLNVYLFFLPEILCWVKILQGIPHNQMQRVHYLAIFFIICFEIFLFAVKGDVNSAPHIFSGGSYRISLSVQNSGLNANGHRIEGSVVNTDDPLAAFDGKVYLTNVDSETRTEPLDDFGFFAVDELPPATYTLLFMLPERSVWIESFEVA